MHKIGALLVVVMAAVIMYDALGRLLFNRPFAGTAELASTAMVVLTFLQVPYVILEKKLLRVTFLFDRVGPTARGALNVFAYLCGTLFFSVLFATSIEPALEGWRIGEYFGSAVFRIPGWPLRFATLFLWLVAALVCLYFLVEALRGRMTEREEQLPD
ncbi:MAG: TRAP transporter small permease [Burkholderiales bacterium]|nr:TRAP transporter small permease [Burkholderiales bacterium]